MKDKKKKLLAAIDLLDLLSHPVRLSVLCNLHHNGEMNVGAIVAAEKGAASQSQISQFLALMRKHKIVNTRKDGQNVYYRLVSPEARAVRCSASGCRSVAHSAWQRTSSHWFSSP